MTTPHGSSIPAPGKKTLTLSLPSDREIMMTRVFDAPRRLVFEAHSKCEHVKHWWGPRRFTLVSCKMDFRPGGAWRYVQRGPDGTEYAFRGEFREIVPPERIVWTFEFEGAPGNIAIETMTLIERGGQTILTTRSLAPSREARDAVLQSGMEKGAAETWDRLAEYVATLKI
ncbi:MAG: SRPBCC family protein [Gemmatimonadales bacterium]